MVELMLLPYFFVRMAAGTLAVDVVVGRRRGFVAILIPVEVNLSPTAVDWQCGDEIAYRPRAGLSHHRAERSCRSLEPEE